MLVLSLGLAACDRAAATSAPLPQVEVTDQRYNGLVFLEIGEGGPTGVYAVRL
jgi:hypothetical protein